MTKQIFARASVLLAALLLCSCVTTPPAGVRPGPPFQFEADTFAYANELVWEYHFDEAGRRTVTRRQPPPTYTHHCFVVVRAARQFFHHAHFAPERPVASDAEYQRLIRRVMSRSPRKVSAAGKRVVIPGYAHLREFSLATESLLKAECGGAHESYFQRGHWRMILPFSRAHQDRIARQLTRSLGAHRPSVVHVVRFPSLAINHAVLIFDLEETTDEIRFAAYDPNSPEHPVRLRYQRADRAFYYPRTAYFAGGRVEVYEIYSKWNY